MKLVLLSPNFLAMCRFAYATFLQRVFAERVVVLLARWAAELLIKPEVPTCGGTRWTPLVTGKVHQHLFRENKHGGSERAPTRADTPKK